MSAHVLSSGAPSPLGVTPAGDGINVAVYSQYGSAVHVCLYDADGGTETARLTLPDRTGAVFHGHITNVPLGTRYGLRVDGPWAPRDGHRFNAAKLLIDPYATALDRPLRLHPSLTGQTSDGRPDPRDSADAVPKAIVLPRDAAGADPPRLARPWGDVVLYELHVRGFTKRHPAVPEALRGTMAGLAHPAAIEHLLRLGVTTIELMPVAAAVDEPHLAAHGLTNYWGYNTIGWMVPDARLAPGGLAEFRATVDALHAAGLEVLLDVVLNHSGEGDETGPTLSLRGLDNATYYRLVPGDAARYVNDTGTGNALALDRAPVRDLALATLRHWVEAAGVDGFRYDLGATLGRGEAGFDPNAEFFAAINAEPVLAGRRHIAEPWDIGHGGYQLGQFPATWGEWNDRYRDRIRHFWRGDGEHVGDFATRISGSPDLFAGRHRPPSRSVNFVTAHDGFTLADLVSYGHKHNEANGESNRDGTNANHSWNHGVEGATDRADVRAARARDVRALLATLLFSRGTPMLAMGDELGRSQQGNNNAYAQDNEISWVDWTNADEARTAFTARLVALRRAYPVLHEDRWLTGEPRREAAEPDVRWLRPDGSPMSYDDWSSGRVRGLVALLSGAEGRRVLLAVHGGSDDLVLQLPPARDGTRWRWMLDSSTEAGEPRNTEPVSSCPLPARSVLLFVEESEESASPPAAPLPRAAGVLLHPTALPSPGGVGDLGPDAHRFVDWLADAGLRVWQMLPLGPTGYGDSPYQCFSAFAGNPLLIHLPDVAGDFPTDRVDFAQVIPAKLAALREASDAFVPDDAYRIFVAEQESWLEDYALFMAAKATHGGAVWTEWDEALRRRDPRALAAWRRRLADDIEHHRRAQYLFFVQFRALRAHCGARGVRLMGDLPIYVSHDSADCWANPQLFRLRDDGRPAVQAGVPPDYFSATGQLWGNPIYDWSAMAADGFPWWITRFRSLLAQFDLIRVDHFRGFEAYWEVPGDATTAEHGHWVPAPGRALFDALVRALGPMPIVAENLGVITPEVEALREAYGLPGMAVMQFAFAGDGSAAHFQPHNFTPHLVAYTGTHDNDTIVGWWNSVDGDSTRSAEDVARDRAYASAYLGTDGTEIHWVMLDALLASVANVAMFPLQDLLGQGSAARMNVPGRPGGNWQYRFAWEALTPAITARLRGLLERDARV